MLRRARRLVLSVVALLSLVLLAATLLLPGWIRQQGAQRASEALGRPVRVAAAHVQPWRLGLVIEGLEIGSAQPDAPPLFTLQRLEAALSLRSLWHLRPVVASLEMTAPTLRLTRTAEGHYDVDDLLARFTQPAPEASSEPAPGLALYNLRLTEGQLLFDDQPLKQRHAITALRLELPFLSTLASDVEVQVQPHLSGQLDGVAFRSEAQTLPFAAERPTQLRFSLDGLDLSPLAAYVPNAVPVRLQSGRLDLDLRLEFAQPARQAPRVKLSGTLGLREVALRQPDGEPLLAWQALRLPLQDLQPLQHRLVLGEVRWTGPRFNLRRDARGLLKLPGGEVPAARPPAAANAPPASPWALSLAGLALEQGEVRWQDAARRPAVDARVEALGLKLGRLQWPLAAAPSPFEATARWAPAQLSLRGELGADKLDAQLQLGELGLDQLAPYLPLPQGDRLVGKVDLSAELQLTQPLAPRPEQRLVAALREVRLAGLRYQMAGDTMALAALSRLTLDRAQIEPGPRRIEVGNLKLDGLQMNLQRDGQGEPHLPAIQPAPASSAGDGPAWGVQLASLSLDHGRLRWRDAAGAAIAVDGAQFQVQDLAWPAAGPVASRFSLQVAALDDRGRVLESTAGRLSWQGRLGLQPLSARGTLKAERLPLQVLDAYLDPDWHLHLARADLGLQAALEVQQSEQGWRAQAHGDLQVAALSLQQAHRADGKTQVGDDLLSWQALQLGDFKLTAAPGTPPQFSAGEARLDDFFARLVINEQGRFNVRDVGPAEREAPSSAPAAAPPRISLGRVVVNRGRVDFTDHFVRPNYSAQLSDLSGSLGRFASGDPAMAPLSLRGKVAGTGQLDIEGQLNPSGAPLAMDLRVNATDIELAPLSPYAAKYAGYALERGKLSAHMSYRVEPGGKLEASNQLILNQLTFGDKVESPDATTLPVRFAVALLKDRNGVIDVNLPVSGSLSDPDFSVGGIVWKLILNLIGKALTSPFALFSGSDQAEEARVSFTPGTSQTTSAPALDRLAHLLIERPGVQLTVVGQVDKAAELDAVRAQRLEAALLAERRREDAAATGVGEPDRERLLKRLYETRKLPDKPKNLLGLAKDLPPAEMRRRLLAAEPVDEEMLRQLALTRGIAVRDALIARGAPNARIFLAAPKLCEQGCDPVADLQLAAH